MPAPRRTGRWRIIPNHVASGLGAGARRRGRIAALALLVAPGLLAGCSLFGRPATLAPAQTLYAQGEGELLRGKYNDARQSFQQIAEFHPDSELAPAARLLVGEAYYRDGEYEKAAEAFTGYLTLHPTHEVADLGQYRLARSYFDQMPTLERDQEIVDKALAEFRKLVRLYPESRYAPDAIVKIEACRLRLAQKELWVADYYVRRGQLAAALARYERVLADYARTSVTPETLFHAADVLVRLARPDEATMILRRLIREYPASEWSRRARESHAALL